MDFKFSPDAVMLCDMLRRFVEDEVKPLEMKYFSSGVLEAKEQARFKKVIEQMGLWGITTPEKFGGGGLDTLTACLLEEELGKTFIPVEIGDLPPLLYACQGEQVKRFLEPALAGERQLFLAVREPGRLKPEEWQTTATWDGETYHIDGCKSLTGRPAQKDFLALFASTPQGPTVFLLDAAQPGLQYAWESNELYLDDCLASLDSILGEAGKAFFLAGGEVPRAAIRLGARYTGLAQRLLSMAAEYSQDWLSLGGLLKDRPAVQRIMAELHVQIECTRWLVYHAAWLADAGEPLRTTAAEVRLATGEMLRKTADLVTLVYGGVGPSAQVEMHRFVRSAIPMEGIEIGLDYARLAIATQLMAES
jgi:acyl-CoA dehydrogenase